NDVHLPFVGGGTGEGGERHTPRRLCPNGPAHVRTLDGARTFVQMATSTRVLRYSRRQLREAGATANGRGYRGDENTPIHGGGSPLRSRDGCRAPRSGFILRSRDRGGQAQRGPR